MELKLLEVGPDGSTRVYTHPQVATLEHKPACVEIASEPHVLHPQIVDVGDKLKVGTSFVLKVKRLDAEKVLCAEEMKEKVNLSGLAGSRLGSAGQERVILDPYDRAQFREPNLKRQF